MALDENRLQKPFKKLRKLLKKFPKDPAPEQVHDLRTNSRKIEAIMQGLMLDHKGSAEKFLRDIKPVRQRGGKVRDMDVLTGFASTLLVDGEDECRVQLLEHLGARRFRQARKLRRAVRAEGELLGKQLKKYSRQVKGLVENPRSEISAEATAVSIRMAADLRNPARLDASNIHDYRKKVKQLRYTLQLAETRDDAFVESLGEVKDAIGEWHDWLELAGIAEKALDHSSGCSLLREIRAVGEKKFAKALQLTNEMREKYAGAPPAKRGPKKPSVGINKPVLVAVSKIAA